MTYTATIRRTRPLECLILPSLLLLLTMGWSRVVMGTGVVGNFIKINITVVLPEGGNRTKTIDTDENSLKTFGITREELSSALIYTNANGEVSEVVMGERHIPLHLEPVRDSSYTSYSFGTVDGGFWSVSASNFTNITIHDLEDDETLEAVEVSLDWSLPPLAQPNPADVTLTSALLEAAIYLDNTTLVRQKVSGRVAIGKWVQMVPYAGVYLQVLNPHTHLTTLAAYFNTQDYFIDRELVHTLTNLMPGRLAFLTSYYDTSGRLGASSRDTLTSLGSFAARYLTFGDCWSWAWRVGGATLAEGLVTNPHGVMSHPPPLNLEVPVSPSPPSERLCESWPLSWNKRQHFCDMYDGYGDLCSCSAPFTLPANATGTGEELGVVVVAGSRARYLFRLLRQLLTQPGVALHQVLVSIDGGYEETIKLVDLLGLRHMRFALYHGVQLLATNKFIILEDDLILAPDFYSYMQQTAVLLDKDPSLFAVSAYAHFSFRHTAHDPTRLYRVHSLPAYGWMVKRSFLEETLPKWPPVFVATDWDYWMGCGLVRRGRELVIPEVSRTSHAGLSGTHFSGFVTQKRFSNKPLSDDPNTRSEQRGVRN
ncbi:O-linked-mannose beta-1-2-N-acetylglucosaminyltransferase 1-like 2 [Homarus americanus]|uniref:Alpha-1,3-mannosyl-glycoprotein 2-beta-N-acetylglucosaminyltransferase n=1 Tax=Homarus americanus TaxID=6706 RepID=A0A8J5MR52_HOMAM|nr:O-linked-mannose beta-1-2-N-acetylglucosaminyltransferase 1-like 2 [Homarus americanus]